MNLDSSDSPREKMEAQLTALLLGELSAADAAAVRAALEQDPALALLYAQLEQTIGLVREVAASPGQPAAAPAVPLQLSAERRERLQMAFKVIPAPAPARDRTWVVPMSIAAVLIALIGSVLLLPEMRQGVASKNMMATRSEVAAPQWPGSLPEEKAVTRAPGTARPENSASVLVHSAPATESELRPNLYGARPEAVSRLEREKGAEPLVRQDLYAKANRPAAPGDQAVAGLAGAPAKGDALDGSFGRGGGIGGGGGFGGRALDQLDVAAAKPENVDRKDVQLSVAPPAPAAAAPSQSLGMLADNSTLPSIQSIAPSAQSWGDYDNDGFLTHRFAFTVSPDGAALATAQQAKEKKSAAFRESEQLGKVIGRVPILGDTPGFGAFFRSEGIVGVQGGTAPTSGSVGQSLGPSLAQEQSGVIQGIQNRPFTVGDKETPSSALKSAAVERLQESVRAQSRAGSTSGQPFEGDPRLMQRYGLTPKRALQPESAGAPVSEQATPTARPRTVPARVLTNGLSRGLESKQASTDLNQLGSANREQRLGGIAQEERQLVEQKAEEADKKMAKLIIAAPIPQPEIDASDNPFSTFSLNVSDVSFKLAAATLEKGQMPDPGAIRVEEFINGFDYRDPEPAAGMPVAFAWERARSPFAHDRDLLRLSVKTAAAGRQAGVPLNIVLLLDRSGSMERADRVRIVQEALQVLAGQLQPQDKLSVVTFARTARLWADGLAGNEAGPVLQQVASSTPEGGTNLEEALNLAYQTALKHYLERGGNRVVLFTDGAANLGNVDPEALKQKVESYRKQGIALDCFGIGWEGFDDDVLETLSRNGDGRYRFLNTPEEAASGFAEQLAGALHVAASDVKVQVEFNPKRVALYRQLGYAKHQLTKEQFRDNTVDAAELAAAESGNAIYSVQVNPAGDGPLAVVRVRFKVPGTAEYREQEWTVPYTGQVVALDEASPSLRLAGTASAFAEWLASNPYAAEVTPDRLLACLHGVAESYGTDTRPRKLEVMIQQAKSLGR